MKMIENLKSACGSMLRRKFKQAALFWLGSCAIMVVVVFGVTHSLGGYEYIFGFEGFEFASCICMFLYTLNEFRCDFHNLIQNGFTRRVIYLSNLCYTVIIAAVLAAFDTIAGNALNFSNFGVYYEYDNYPMNWLYLFLFYICIGMLAYLLAVLHYKFKRSFVIVLAVLLNFMIVGFLSISSSEYFNTTWNCIRILSGFNFVVENNEIWFTSGINYLIPLSIFAAFTAIFALISRAIFVRLEVKN